MKPVLVVACPVVQPSVDGQRCTYQPVETISLDVGESGWHPAEQNLGKMWLLNGLAL